MDLQPPLGLPRRIAMGRGDFFAGESNALALAMIERWQGWPGRKLALIGPRGAGKTHLAHVWAELSGARLLAARNLVTADIEYFAAAPVCIEDIDHVAGSPDHERAMFHLHNLALAEGQALMLTAEMPPAAWSFRLPDLASRMQGTQVARLSEPDDVVLGAVLAKLFADRHSVPAADVIPYLLRHMPRSFEMAGRVVAEIDRRALGTRSGATRRKAAEALAALAADTPGGAQ